VNDGENPWVKDGENPHVVLALAFFIAVVIGWAVTYPSDSDPKNIKYVLWKNGLYGMDIDSATRTMTRWSSASSGSRIHRSLD
jgi:hypothetical protein